MGSGAPAGWQPVAEQRVSKFSRASQALRDNKLPPHSRIHHPVTNSALHHLVLDFRQRPRQWLKVSKPLLHSGTHGHWLPSHAISLNCHL